MNSLHLHWLDNEQICKSLFSSYYSKSSLISHYVSCRPLNVVKHLKNQVVIIVGDPAKNICPGVCTPGRVLLGATLFSFLLLSLPFVVPPILFQVGAFSYVFCSFRLLFLSCLLFKDQLRLCNIVYSSTRFQAGDCHTFSLSLWSSACLSLSGILFLSVTPPPPHSACIHNWWM